MNAWLFVIAAWALTLGATGIAAAWSFVGMRRAEARADALTRR